MDNLEQVISFYLIKHIAECPQVWTDCNKYLRR